MFGFRNRKKYNGTVDVKLNNEYQIRTRDNPNFPGSLKYLEYIDVGWNNNASEDECAMQIATLYLCGLIRHKLVDEEREVANRIKQIGSFGVDRGLIREQFWENCNALIENNRRGVSGSQT